MTADRMIHRLPVLPALIAYIAGVLLQYYWLQTDKLHILWPALFGLTLFILLLARRIRANIILSKLTQALLMFAFALLGTTLTAASDVRNDDKWFGKTPEQYEAFAIEIVERPKEKARTVLLPAKVKFGLKDGTWQGLSGPLPVYVYKHDDLPEFQVGQQFIIPANIVRLKHNNNPGSFDLAKKQNQEGLYFQGFLGHSQMLKLENMVPSSWLQRTRAYLLHQLDTFIHDPISRSLTQATLLNEADNMDPQMQKDYAATGISHIIAISGMHVNLLFGLLVLPLFWIRDKRKLWLKYLLVVPFVWIYVALCDLPPSAVRAAVGFSLFTVTLLWERPQHNIHLLTLNAFTLLICDPMWLFHIGVQLSFLAVLSILIFYPVMKRWYSSRYWFINILWETIAVSLAVQILVFPLVIFYFHQFPVWFLLANLLAALFSLLQMTMAFGIMLFGVLNWPLLARGLGFLLEEMTGSFNRIVAWLNANSWDLSRQIPLDGLDYFLLMAGIVLLAVYWLRRHFLSLLSGLGMVLVLFVNMVFQNMSAAAQERIVVYAGTRRSCIEVMKGRFSWVYIDSISEQVEQFALKPARLKFRIGQQERKPLQDAIWRIADIQVAFVHDGSKIPREVPDVLILSTEATLEVAMIPPGLKRSLFVLDGSFGRSASLRYAKKLASGGIKVHNVQTDGAWWYYAGK